MGGRRRGSPPLFQYAVHPMIIVGYHGMRPRGDGTGGGGRWVVPVRSRPPGVRSRSRPERRGDTEDGGRPGETPHGRRGRGESHQCTVRWFYFSNPSSPRAREASRGPHTPPPTCGRSASGPSPGSEGGGEGMREWNEPGPSGCIPPSVPDPPIVPPQRTPAPPQGSPHPPRVSSPSVPRGMPPAGHDITMPQLNRFHSRKLSAAFSYKRLQNAPAGAVPPPRHRFRDGEAVLGCGPTPPPEVPQPPGRPRK